MPKSKVKLAIHLNLLKPQSNPEQLPVKLFRWLLLSGRYIFVFVEALVLIAFAARFKLDADIATKKEAIDEQIPYIESLKDYDTLIRQTQVKLATIDDIKTNSFDWSIVLKKITDQMPTSITATTINMEKNAGGAAIHITGQTPSNSDLQNFISGLKEENSFSNISLANVGLEQRTIKFSINLSAKLISAGGQNL